MLGQCRHILPELSQDCLTEGDIELGGTAPGGEGDQKGNVGIMIYIMIIMIIYDYMIMIMIYDISF